MILYLSRNENANLLDGIANENALHIRKMSGSFGLHEFIVRDMRKFASCRYFCVERLAITEKDSDFLEALQSFQMMYDARIIVIYESVSEVDGLTRGLVQIGVTDIVTAPDMTEKLSQLAECLSTEGMLRYKPNAAKAKEPDEEKETLAQSVILKEMEDEQYRFDCLNVNIGIIGATHRVGTTTVAMGLANFIQNHGGTACYVALNLNRHLDNIANMYHFDTEDDFYTHNAIDFYEGIHQFQRKLNRTLRKRSAKIAIRKAYTALNKAAVIVVLIATVFIFSTMTVQALRVGVLNFLIGLEQEYTSIRLDGDRGNSIIGDNLYVTWTNAFVPEYIPTGFKITKLSHEKDYKIIVYSNEEGQTIYYSEHTEAYETNLDTENATRVENITVKGYDALLVEKDGVFSVAWSNGEQVFLIYASISEDEILKIAESIRFIQ